MSQENVEVVVSGRGTPLEGIHQGHAEVRKLWADIRESFAEARFDIARATEHDGVVLVLGTLRLRGTGSGAVADTPFGLVTEFEHGVGKRQFFWTGDQSKALEAVGLAE